MDVEQLAVTRIVEIISRCPRLQANIEVNDKTLITDGHIEVFNGEVKSGRTFSGRVFVQVKGRTGIRAGTFAIPVADLRGYLKIKGVLYFVVAVDKKTGERNAHYAILSPFKIQDMLESLKSDQKSVSVRLKAFPTDPRKVEGIVALALQVQSEDPVLRLDPRNLDDVSHITIYTEAPIDLTAPLRLTRTESDYSLVFHSSAGARLPVSGNFEIIPLEYVGEDAGVIITCGEVVYQNVTRKRVNPSTIELALSDGVKVTFVHEGGDLSGEIELKLTGSIERHFEDLSFLFAVQAEGGFTVDGKFVGFTVQPISDDSSLIPYFAFLRKIHSTLLLLGVNLDLIDMASVSSLQREQLLQLHDAFANRTEVIQGAAVPGRVVQPIGAWSIELVRAQDADSMEWSYRSLFDPALRYRFAHGTNGEPGEREFYLVTPYEVVDEKRLPYTLNLCLERIVEAYAAIDGYAETVQYANLMVLKLIQAADTVAIRSDEFLRAADALNEWLIGHDRSAAHHLINRWQIAARQDRLSDSDESQIMELAHAVLKDDREDFSIQARVCCAILLGNWREVDYLMGTLASEDRQTIEGWPIWNLRPKAVPAIER